MVMDHYDCYVEEADFWKCWKHPSQPRHGVCAGCLRDRLSLLCAVCASVRPCTCEPPSSGFVFPSAAAVADGASSSTSSSLSAADVGIGSVAPMSLLLSSEPSFRRSRSAAFAFLRNKPPAVDRPRRAPAEEIKPRLSTSSSTSSSSSSSYFWLFWRSSEKGKRRSDRKEAESKVERLSRTRSVGVSCRPDVVAEVAAGGMKGRGWHFPSPIKAFRQTKAEKIVQQRSPLCRG